MFDLNHYTFVETTSPEFVMESTSQASPICGFWALENLAWRSQVLDQALDEAQYWQYPAS